MKRAIAWWIPEIALGMIAAILGFSVEEYLRTKWFYEWMYIFADGGDRFPDIRTPAMNPAYYPMSRIFYQAPVVASSLMSGLIAGLGKCAIQRLIVRIISGPSFLFMFIFLVTQKVEALLVFASFFIISIVSTSVISLLYASMLKSSKPV